MFGNHAESVFSSIVNRNLNALPQGILRQRVVELREFLIGCLIKNDPQVEIAILTRMVRDAAVDASLSPGSLDMEVLFYLKLVLSSESNNPPEVLRCMQQLRNIMEFRVSETLSKDPVVRKTQGIFICENLREYLSSFGNEEKKEVADLLSFFSKASEESQDLEFSSSLGIIVQALMQPAAH